MSFKGVAFLLEVMTKSMILKIHSTGEISACLSLPRFHLSIPPPITSAEARNAGFSNVHHHHHHHH
jgi:hypothetical protein